MAVQPQATLAEMTAHVLEAIGEGGDGVAAPNTQATIKSLLRRSQATMLLEAPWTINKRSVEIELPAGETSFEVPDGATFGSIRRIAAMRSDDPQDTWDLEGGISTADRSAWLSNPTLGAETNNPCKYEFTDGMIEVGPACSDDITIRVDYEVGVAVLVDEGDRPNCDSTALEMMAEIAFRNARGGDFRQGIPAVAASLSRYMDLLRPRQGTPRTIQIGRKADILDPARRRSYTNQRHWADRNRRP